MLALPFLTEAPAMLTDPSFYLAAIPAVLIVGISKGGFGGGLALVAVPMLALVIAPTQAAAIMLPILCLMDLVAMWGFRGRFDRNNLKILLPAAALGITLGALSFHQLSEDHLKLLIGGVTLSFCLNTFWQALNKQLPEAKPASPGRGSFWGLLAGFTSFSVHAGGPPLNFYLLPQRLEKSLFAGTTVLFFAAINYMKLIPYGMLGLLQPGNITTSLVLMPLAAFGVWLGIKLHSRVDETLFYRFCYGFLFLTGCKLCWEAGNALF
ncbi:sulfite exporter TauE/SafE family protein [Marinobacterium jannaschii]|uniref:sulfite exporter TauE/SafE family protein n=1 Tax=Marinobacterium jannaschii TaxID=64970 RepID=UPI000AD9697A|nr:sulfite exporter TauE/SafE family protein [Marinobacterium jannaschii]